METAGIWSPFLSRLHKALTGSELPDHGHADAQAGKLAFFVAILAFGFELSNPTLGIDDYLHLAKDFAWHDIWIARGMWGGLVLHWVIPGGWVVPFITLFLGIVLQLHVAIVLGWLFGFRNFGVASRALLFSVFVTFPYFAAQMAFSYLQIGFPLASLLCVAGLLIANSHTVFSPRLILAPILLAMGVSVYQGSLSVLAVAAGVSVFCTLNLPQIALGRRLRQCLWFILTIALGILLYFVVHKTIVAAAGVVPRSGYYSVSMQPEFWERWDDIKWNIGQAFFGYNGVIPAIPIYLFMLAGIVAGADFLRQSPDPKTLAWRSALATLMAITLLIAPFGVLFLHKGGLTPRSVVGLAVSWFAVFSFMLGSVSPIVRRTGMVMVGWVVLVFVFQDNRMFFSQYLTAQADRIMISRIAERVDILDRENSAGRRPKVVMVGSYSHPPYPGVTRYAPGAVLGYSNFEWDGGNHRRMKVLAASAGLDRYAWLRTDLLGEQETIDQMLEGRRPWPAKSSVFLHQDKIVVWLGSKRDWEHGPVTLKSFLAMPLSN